MRLFDLGAYPDQISVDSFCTWIASGLPLVLYTFSLQYSSTLGSSNSLICAPPSGSGIDLDNTYGKGVERSLHSQPYVTDVNPLKRIARNGFTSAFYMTNYCWDNMVDYPAKSVNYTSHTNHPGGQVFQVFDEDRLFQFRNSIR